MAPQTKPTVFFGLGLSFGMVLTVLFTTYFDVTLITPKISRSFESFRKSSRDTELGVELTKTRDFIDNKILFPNEKVVFKESSRTLQSLPTHEQIDKMSGPNEEYHFNDEHHHHDDSTIAEDLYKRVRILCWVMTSPQNLQTKAIHVKATWGKRCNKLIFMSSVTNTSFPTIGLKVPEGREHLTAKTMRAFDYVADNFMEEADWFMKADDDTYVILENLRYFLSDIDTNMPIFYGHYFKQIVKQGYFSGGGGYVLSKEALKRLRGRGESQCRKDGGAEDAELGNCMQNLGVKTGYSLDAMGRSRFHCFDPETHLFGGYPNWYYSYDGYGAKQGISSISDYAITFHYVPPNKMYSLEFYVYHLRPYGVLSKLQNLNSNRTVVQTPKKEALAADGKTVVKINK